MTPYTLDVGFQEDLRGIVDACGLGGRDAWERLRGWARGEGRAMVEARGAAIDRRFPALLAAWTEAGCPRTRASPAKAFFRELAEWTDGWATHHPETRGRFAWGDGVGEVGALTVLLRPAADGRSPHQRWTDWAMAHREPWGEATHAQLVRRLVAPEVRAAVLSLDLLLCHLYRRHFGALPASEALPAFLDAVYRYAGGELGDRPTGEDPVWFRWGFVIESAELLAPGDGRAGLRRAWMAGLVVGAATEAVRTRRYRTRGAYAAAPDLAATLHRRGRALAQDLAEGSAELRDLQLIRIGGEQHRAPPPGLEGAA